MFMTEDKCVNRVKGFAPLALALNNAISDASCKTVSLGAGPNKKKRASAATRSSGSDRKPRKKRPKRILTPYNLFFRYERARLLLAFENSSSAVPPEALPDKSRLMSEVRHLLANNPFEIDNRTRSHRKTHGKVSFQDMVQHISVMWKAADDETKAVFKELAKEDKLRHAREMQEYKSHCANNGQEVAPKRCRKERDDSDDRKLPQREMNANNISTCESEIETTDMIKKALALADTPMLVDGHLDKEGPMFWMDSHNLSLCQKEEDALWETLPGHDSEDSKLPVAADLVDFV